MCTDIQARIELGNKDELRLYNKPIKSGLRGLGLKIQIQILSKLFIFDIYKKSKSFNTLLNVV